MEPSLLKLLLLAVAGWLSREQQAVIEYLREENRILKTKLPSGRRLLFSDSERRRLAMRSTDSAKGPDDETTPTGVPGRARDPLIATTCPAPREIALSETS